MKRFKRKRRQRDIFELLKSNHISKLLITTILICGFCIGLIDIPREESSSYQQNKLCEENNNSKPVPINNHLSEKEIKEQVITLLVDKSKIGYVLDDLNLELRLPLETGKKFKTEQLDENGNPVQVLNERTGFFETQYVVRKEKVDQIIKVEHGHGVVRLPGDPKNAYCHFDMPVSYMDKVMVNVESFFYEQCYYIEYQGSSAKYLVDNKDTIWQGRNIDDCLNWENIKYRMPTHLGHRTELIDIDGEHRYVHEPSDLQKVLSHFVNFTVECGIITNKKLNKLLKGDEIDKLTDELEKSTHHYSTDYDVDPQELVDALLNMDIEYNEDTDGYEFYSEIPVSNITMSTVTKEYVGLHLSCDNKYNLSRFEFPGYKVKKEGNWDYITLNGGDIKLKIDSKLKAEPVRKPELQTKVLNSYRPMIDSLSLFDSILKFVTKPKLRYKTRLSIEHAVNGPCYSKLTDGDGNLVDFYDPEEDLAWYRNKGIDTSLLRHAKNKKDIIETAYINADGATNFGDGIKFSDIKSTVATNTGYDINIGIVEDKIDAYGNKILDTNGNNITKNISKHHLTYSWDKEFNDGQGMNYFEYEGVAKYKAPYVDFNSVLGYCLNFYSKFFNESDETAERTKKDFWKYVDALGESKLRRTVGLMIDDVFRVVDDPDCAASIKEGNVKDLTDIITHITVFEDGSGGETVFDFEKIGLSGEFVLKARNKCVPGYIYPDDNHPEIEGMNDKFVWKFININVGGFLINGTIDFISCNEDDEYFLEKYVKCYGPQNSEDEKTYQEIKYFNDVVNQIFTFNENRELALKLEAKAYETRFNGNDLARGICAKGNGGFDLISKGAVDFDEHISWSEHSLLKYSPTFKTGNLKTGRNGSRAQEFLLDIDLIENSRPMIKIDSYGAPILDEKGDVIYVNKPGTNEPIQVVDTQNSNVFIRLESSTRKGRAGYQNSRLEYNPPSRPYVDKYGYIPHPIEGWSAVESYIDLIDVIKSVLNETPDIRFSKFMALLSTDILASTTLDTVIDQVKNGNIINPLLSTKMITKIIVGDEHSLDIGINKELGGGKLAEDLEIHVTTKKHVFESPEQEERYNKLHPDHEARDVYGFEITTRLASNDVADGMTSYDGLDIDIHLTMEDYLQKDHMGKYEYKVEDNFRFTDYDSQGHGPHDINNEKYTDFSTVEHITESLLNTAWLGSGARYFKEYGHTHLRETTKNGKKVIDNGNLNNLKPGDFIKDEEQIGPSTYHIRFRFNRLAGQFLFKIDLSYLTMDFWVYMHGGKARVLAIINMPCQQGFNDKFGRPTYYGGGLLGSNSCFVKSMVLYEVGYTPKSEWTEIDKKLNRDTGKVYMFRSFKETNSYSGWNVVDYRMTTGFYFRRHIQEWVQYYLLGDHYPNGGAAGNRQPFYGKSIYPQAGEVNDEMDVQLLNANMYPEDIFDYYRYRVDHKTGNEVDRCTWNMGINFHDLISFNMKGLKTKWTNNQLQREDRPIDIEIQGVSSYLKRVDFTASFHPVKILKTYAWADTEGYLDLYNLDNEGNYTNCWEQNAMRQYTFTQEVDGSTITGLFENVKNYCEENFVMTPIPWCSYNDRTKVFSRYTYPDNYERNGYCWIYDGSKPKQVGGYNARWREFANWKAASAKNYISL